MDLGKTSRIIICACLIIFFVFLLAYYFLHFKEGMGFNLVAISHPLLNTKGLIQYYNFEMNTRKLPKIRNEAASLSQDTYDATLSSDAGTLPTFDTTDPKVGNSCLKLDASQKQFIQLPSFIVPGKPDTTISTPIGMTLTLWFKMNTVGVNTLKTLFDYSNSKYRMTACIIDDVIHFTSVHGGNSQKLTSKTIIPGTWFHLAICLSPENGRAVMYLDYVKDAALPDGTKFIYPLNEIVGTLNSNVIGKCTAPYQTYLVNDSYFDGFIDQYIVYNSYFGPEEIQKLKNIFDTKNANYSLE